MGLVQTVFRMLRAVGDPVVDRAMAEALPTADRLGQRLIVLSLLERRQIDGCLGLVRVYHTLDRGLRGVILEHMEDIEEAVRLGGRDAEAQVRLNAAEMVTGARGYRLALTLGELSRDADGRVNKAATGGLLEMARSLGEERSGSAEVVRQLPARRTGWVAAAIAQACAGYASHGRRDALLAALALAPRRVAEVTRQLTGHAPAATVARELIRSGEAAEIERSLLWCAGVEPLAPAVVERLGRRNIRRDLGQILRMGHLLATPAARATVRRVGHADHLVVGIEEVAAMAPEAQRQAARWMRALSVDSSRRVEGLARVAGSGDALTRLLGARGLMAMGDAAADDALAGLCFDEELAIARLVLGHLRIRRWHGLSTLMVRLVGSPHEEIRRVAERELAPMGFANLWLHWEKLDEAVRRGAGRALMKIDRDFHRQLAVKMIAVDADDRFKAVMIARHLHQETYFEAQLLKLARDPSAAVASAAVAALGELHDSPLAADAVRQALGHANDRVKANAVESLEQMDRVEEAGPELSRLVYGPGNRSRANAIKALMGLPLSGAGRALEQMLDDPDAAHRMSALWVVERLAHSALSKTVAVLARTDTHEAVRRRAQRVLRAIARRLEMAEPGMPSAARGVK